MNNLESELMGWQEGARCCRARTEVLAHAVLIFRIRARLKETMADPATPARLSQIKLIRLRLAVEPA